MRQVSLSLRFSPCDPSYAVLCAQGWDTVQEAMALHPSPELVDLLDKAKQRAGNVQDNLEGIVPVDFGSEFLNCHATGAKGGFAHRLSNEDFIVMIGSPRREWTVSVRYLSAGLWAHGLTALRERVFRLLGPHVRQDTLDCVRVSRADWCFDFWAPHLRAELTADFLKGLVHHAMTKDQLFGQISTVKKGLSFQTVTMGSKTGCQLQLYDKTAEINEMSGKTWLYGIWKDAIGYDPWEGAKPKDVFRIEARFASDFLKERNIRRPFEVMDARARLVAEALVNRRATIPLESQERERWPMHPLWSAAFKNVAVQHLLPVGRCVTGRRSELITQGLKQLAGLLRNCSVLSVGADDETTRDELVKRAVAILEADPKHQMKVDRAMDRYAAVDFAR